MPVARNLPCLIYLPRADLSWDFSTEPEFEAELAWIREYVDSRILPLEIAGDNLNQHQLDALWQPLKDEVRARGLWAPHLPPAHGGSRIRATIS